MLTVEADQVEDANITAFHALRRQRRRERAIDRTLTLISLATSLAVLAVAIWLYR